MKTKFEQLIQQHSEFLDLLMMEEAENNYKMKKRLKQYSDSVEIFCGHLKRWDALDKAVSDNDTAH